MNEQSYIERTSGIKFIDKFGYALGDFASLTVFGLTASLLNIFYTDSLGIPAGWLIYLFLVARVWDAINDPIWGRIIDKCNATKQGRYRPWLLRMAIPLGLSAILMFAKLPGLSTTQYYVYAFITYILFGMVYTCINIPYGSLASVITTNDKERVALSTFRSVGSVFGNFPVLILTMLPYTTEIAIGSGKVSVLFIGVCCIALISVLGFVLSYKFTKERVPVQPQKPKEKGETMAVIKHLFKSRPFVSLCLASMLLIAGQMFTQGYYMYLFKYYFKAQGLYILVQVAQYLPVAVLMFFMGKLVRKYGRKEICALGMLFAGIVNFVLFFMQTQNVWAFLAVILLSGIGSTFFFLQVWTLVTDTIDYNEVSSGKREDATSYAFFSFTRKIGQTVAGIFVNLCLVWIGYNVDTTANTPTALSKMYNLAVLIPAVMYILMFIVLWFMYPLDKKNIALLQIQKEQNLKKYFEEQQQEELS